MSASTRADRRERPPIELGRVGFDLLLVLIIGVFVVQATLLRPQAGLVPLIVGIPTLAALLVRTILDVGRWGKDHRPQPDALEDSPSLVADEMAGASLAEIARAAKAEVEADERGPADPKERARQRFYALWVTAIVVVGGLATTFVPGVLGFHTWYVPACFVALVVVFRVIKLGWLKTLAISIGLVGVLYYLLAVLLEVRL
jgi:hypothetical protein